MLFCSGFTMTSKGRDLALQWTFFTLLLNFYLTDGSPPGYNLFQGPAYSGAAHRHRNRNWCAYVVHKNVSCAVQGAVESYLEPEVLPCPTHEPDCQPQVMHRTRFRPTYKIASKTVTELEWRCCPGHQGPDCKDLKTSPNRHTQPSPRPNNGQPRHTQPSPLPNNGQTRHTQPSPLPNNGQTRYTQPSPLPNNGQTRHTQPSPLPNNGQTRYTQPSPLPNNGQTRHTQPSPLPNNGQPRHTQRAERRETGHHEARYGVPDKVRLLEGEVQRLSQTVLDLQTAMTGFTANLRTDLQEDTSKMLVTLLNNMRPPDSARAGVTEESAVHLDGHQATRGGAGGDRGLEKVMARLDDMNDALKSKDEALEELRGTVMGQEGQIRLLMDASQSQGPAVVEGGAPSDLDVLQTYIDNKFEKLRKELDQGMEERMSKLQSSCDDRIRSAQKTCEEKGLVSLTELVDTREAHLRKEIQELRLDMTLSDGPAPTQRQTDPADPGAERDDHKELWREVERVAEAHRVLNARMDNELAYLAAPRLDDEYGPLLEDLEARINVTEQNAEVHCFYIEEKLSKALADEAAAVRQLLGERIASVEDQFTSMLVEMSNSSFPGMFGDSMDAIQAEVDNNKFLLQGLDDKINAVGEMCSSGCSPGSSSPGSSSPGSSSPGSSSPGSSSPGSPSHENLASIVKDVRLHKNNLDVLHADVTGNSDKLRELEDIIDRQILVHQHSAKTVGDLQRGFISLQDNVGGLAGAVTGLGDSVSRYYQDVQRMNSTCCQAGQSSAAGPGWPEGPAEGTVPRQQAELTNNQLEELRNRLDRLSSDLGGFKEGVSRGAAAADGRVSRLETACGRRDAALDSVKEGLERHAADLSDDVRRMNATLGAHAGDIGLLRSAQQGVQAQLSGLAKHILKDVTAKEPGTGVRLEGPGSVPDSRTTQIQSRPRITHIPQIHIPLIVPRRPVPGTARPPVRQPSRPRLTEVLAPRRPVLETGEAGPPGFMRRVTVRRAQGSEDSSTPVQGFAGAPGYPPVKPVSFKPETIPAAARVPWNPSFQTPVVSTVLSESSASPDSFSFSAGLTRQAFSGDFGIVLFNRVLVNDGGHYSPHTGVFTAPVDGRYLISGLLASAPGDQVEAVLSVSDRSVQRLQSGGCSAGRPEGGGPCGGSVAFSLILPLRRGERVAVLRTAGRLATTDAREVLSTFSGIFLYAPQASR